MTSSPAAGESGDPRLLKASWFYSACLGAVVSIVKVVQHRAFQTQAWDLGVYTNMLWNSAHGRFFYDSFKGINYLGDHFSPGLILLAPLLELWESAAVLLVVQTLALVLAIPAIYLLAQKELEDPRAAFRFAILFSVFPVLHWTIKNDFHAVALAVPLLSWTLYFWRRSKMGMAILLLAFALLLQEDIALVAAGWGAGMAWTARRKNPDGVAWGLGITAACLLAFVIEVFVIMPRYAPRWRPLHWSFYSHLGRTPAEMILSLANPYTLFKATLADPIKIVSLAKLLLLSGGLPLAALSDCIPLLAPLLIAFSSRYPIQYTLHDHYGATLLPLLFYASIRGYARIRNSPGLREALRFESWSRSYLALLAVVSIVARPGYSPRESWSESRLETFREISRTIPADDSVSATWDLAPHLALRCRIVDFPHLVPPACGLATPERTMPQWVFLDTKLTGWTVKPADRDAQERFMSAHRGQLVASKDGFELYHLTRAP